MKSNLISRQAAIDALYKMLHDCFWADDEELDAVITTLNDLPSAQQDVPDTNVGNMISRQAAIDALCGECQGRCIPCEHYPCGEVKALEQLPSAQPEVLACGEGVLNAQPIDKDTNVPSTDCISRQAAIDLFLAEGMITAAVYVERMPSAQPEIIRCRDCQKCQIDSIYHDYWCDGRKVWRDHYCGYAERRTDEPDR